MPQIGPLEILVVAVLALLVFGPDKLPEIARTVGKTLSQLKHMAADAKSQFDASLDDEPEKSQVRPDAVAPVVAPNDDGDSVGSRSVSAASR